MIKDMRQNPLPEASNGGVLLKKDVYKNFAKFTGNYVGVFFLKETPTRLFFCEFCQLFMNIFFATPLSNCFCMTSPTSRMRKGL